MGGSRIAYEPSYYAKNFNNELFNQNRDAPMNNYSETLQWLLEQDSPSLKLRTRKEILGMKDEDPVIQRLRQEIPFSSAVADLLNSMHSDGYWLQKNSAGKQMVGDGVVYGSFGSTHFVLSYLAELAMDRSDPRIAQAAERYLSLQQPDGDWLGHFSCLIGYNIRTFLMLGYGNDPRVARSVNYLLQTTRPDGGYLCDIHEKITRNRKCKSCIRGSVKALMAFSELPDTWSHPRVKQLIDYFLQRGGVFTSKNLHVPVNKDMVRPSFPINWRANTWEVLYALSKMGVGEDPRLIPAWNMLDNNEDISGRQTLFWTPTGCPWKVGNRGEANPWLTFYGILARNNLHPFAI
jgi:hypothetical protein